MRIHILGIGGTFMAGIAQIAKQAGHEVQGSDLNVYPPMSTQLEKMGVMFFNGYDAANIDSSVDCVIVGNVIKRGNPAMEYVLNQGIPFCSGPEWLAQQVLQNRWVLAVSGTHGKTTTTSMLTWIMEYAGKDPGFLIGGVPENFGFSARIGSDPFFIIEADEYDSAFFDKRSKFIHYHPQTLIMNNLEFDHADIFSDLDAVKQQFHYMVRTVPGKGLIIRHGEDVELQDVLDKGCWTPVTTFGGPESVWQADLLSLDGSRFNVKHKGEWVGEVKWDLLGKHNVDNALAAIAAALHAGVSMDVALKALPLFKNVKRRLELKGVINGVTLYDDFAHHPTAIATTLSGLRAKVGNARVIVVLEFGSYTMRMGIHKDDMKKALSDADRVFCKRPATNDWNLDSILGDFPQATAAFDDVGSLVESLANEVKFGDHVIVMSNSGFDDIHTRLLNALKGRVCSV